MKYATCYGGLYRMTNREWKQYLVAHRCGIAVDVPGTQVAPEVPNVTDITDEMAKELLGIENHPMYSTYKR